MNTRAEDKANLIAAANDGVYISAEKADLQILVGNDGVWLGFFGSDGDITMLNVEGLARGDKLGAEKLARLSSWADDRRNQVGGQNTG